VNAGARDGGILIWEQLPGSACLFLKEISAAA